MFNKIHFDCLKAYHHFSTEPEVEQIQMSLTSDMPSYDLPEINVTVPNRPLSRFIIYKDSHPIYSEWTQTYMLENQDTELYRNEGEI